MDGTHSYPLLQPVCLTSQCIVLSAAILSSIDDTQDPCENFYDFSSQYIYSRRSQSHSLCISIDGGWINSHPLPADKGSFGNFDLLSQANQQVIRKILESDAPVPSAAPSYDDEILRKLRTHYSSCMNETALDEIGEEPLLHLVRTVRKLYRGETTDINMMEDKEGKNQNGLTAAIAFLHSRGTSMYSWYLRLCINLIITFRYQCTVRVRC
jgi:endothelin-converting enzyme